AFFGRRSAGLLPSLCLRIGGCGAHALGIPTLQVQKTGPTDELCVAHQDTCAPRVESTLLYEWQPPWLLVRIHAPSLSRPAPPLHPRYRGGVAGWDKGKRTRTIRGSIFRRP